MRATSITPRRLVGVALCAPLLLGGVAPAQSTPEQLARKAFPSVVMIVTADSTGQPLALGSGFFVRNGLVATNLHVIRGAASGQVKMVGKEGSYPIEGTLAVDASADLALLKVGGLDCGGLGVSSAWNLDPPPKSLGAATVRYFRSFVAQPILVGPLAREHPAWVRQDREARAEFLKKLDAMSDASIIENLMKQPDEYEKDLSRALKATDWNCPPSLPLASPTQPAVGDAVFAVGNPEGLEGTFSDGIVSGVRTLGPQGLLQITAPVSPGSSGGPVLNSEGRVVGVAEATLREGQNLNFAVPAQYISTLLGNAATTATPLSALALPPTSDSPTPQVGPALISGVTAGKFLWDKDEFTPGVEPAYSFTVINHLSAVIKDIDILVIFYASDGSPVDSSRMQIAGPIFPGAGVRAGGPESDGVARLAGLWNDPSDTALPPDSARVKFRVLNFRVVR